MDREPECFLVEVVAVEVPVDVFFGSCAGLFPDLLEPAVTLGTHPGVPDQQDSSIEGGEGENGDGDMAEKDHRSCLSRIAST